MHDDVRLFFEQPPAGFKYFTHEESDKGHGRIETRYCAVSDDVSWLRKLHDWKGLRSIVCITATRRTGEKTSVETRYYISSDAPDPVRMLTNTRSHWAIENTLHYTLDMSFGVTPRPLLEG